MVFLTSICIKVFWKKIMKRGAPLFLIITVLGLELVALVWLRSLKIIHTMHCIYNVRGIPWRKGCSISPWRRINLPQLVQSCVFTLYRNWSPG